MATVTPLFSFGGRDGGDVARPSPRRDATNGELAPLQYLVRGLVADEDPTTVAGVPQPNSSVSTGGRSYQIDRVDTMMRFVEDDGTSGAYVAAYASTDRRFRFPPRPIVPEIGDWNIQTSFRTETRTAPTFITREVIIPQSDGAEIGSLEWAQEPIQYQLDWAILQVSATIPEPTSKADFLDIYELASEQNGYLHSFLNRYWRFTPAFMDRSSTGIVQIVYTWESDPGNWEIGARVGLPTAPGATIPAPYRPPFFEYQVVGSSGFGLPPPEPTILLTDLYPGGDDNPYIDLDGWQNLPGNPLG